MSARQVVCFGEALIDFLAKPGSAPPQFLQYAGGAPANVAVAVVRLGGPAAFVGMLGEDMFGDFLLHELQAAGVDTGSVVRTDTAKTALAFVSLDAHGERRFSFYRPPAADLLFRPEHFAPDCFRSAAIFHACSNSLTEEAIAAATLEGMQRARGAGVLVSFDLNLRPNLWRAGEDPRPRIWQALQAAHLVKLSAVELAFLVEPRGSEQAVLADIWRGSAELVVVTDGAAPLRYFTRQGVGGRPAFRVQAVDTTAAGDAFVGGLLFSLARAGVTASKLAHFAGVDPAFAGALRFAAACGALTVTRQGAFAAMPSLAEVEAFLLAQA
jgi:fructokinase